MAQVEEQHDGEQRKSRHHHDLLIPQIICRINWNAAHKNFIMEMGSGGPARHSHRADDLALANFLSHNYCKVSQMSILGGKAIPMVNQ